MKKPCATCGGATLIPVGKTILKPCPECYKQRRAESYAKRMAAGETWQQILGLQPAGFSICHPKFKDSDGGALLI